MNIIVKKKLDVFMFEMVKVFYLMLVFGGLF